MKKILAIIISIMFCGGAYADVQQAEITHSQYRPHWSMVAPTKWSDVAYKEPIKRGKWVKPVAWVGYVGTLFIVPFPLFITAKDKNIATNNQWNIFRENFERDLDNCERLYKQEKDLLKCYNETRATHISFFSMVNDDVNAEKMIQLQQQAIIQNSGPHYQHSTTTRYGNTYYTNSYSY